MMPSSDNYNPCVFCDYAKMRDDICGIYCVGEYWKNSDGTCDHYKPYGCEEAEAALDGKEEDRPCLN